jgi:hypothetical protein
VVLDEVAQVVGLHAGVGVAVPEVAAQVGQHLFVLPALQQVLQVDLLHGLHVVALLQNLQEVEVEVVAVVIIPQPLDDLDDGLEVVVGDRQVGLSAHVDFEVDVLDDDVVPSEPFIDLLRLLVRG